MAPTDHSLGNLKSTSKMSPSPGIWNLADHIINGAQNKAGYVARGCHFVWTSIPSLLKEMWCLALLVVKVMLCSMVLALMAYVGKEWFPWKAAWSYLEEGLALKENVGAYGIVAFHFCLFWMTTPYFTCRMVSMF